MAQPEQKTLADKLQSVPKSVLFLILILCTSLPLFLPEIKVPNKPDEATMDLYHKLMTIPTGSTVLISSDWTNSTRGESVGQFDALIKILMRRDIKFAIFTAADAQAPQVARDEIAVLNRERKDAGLKTYEQWNDYVILGYFPNAEGTLNAIRTNVQKAFAGKKVVPPGQTDTMNQVDSPVLKNIQKVEDFAMVIVVTASNTSKVTIERLSDKLKAGGKLAMQVTGVMGPETRVYYDSGQLGGLSIGLKGVYDLEMMMENGLNSPNFETAAVKWDKYKDTPVPGFPGMVNKGKGTLYYPTLHFAAFLLIIAVLVGNIGMVLSRRKAN